MTVFIVDPDKDIRVALSDVLSEEGFDTKAFATVEEVDTYVQTTMEPGIIVMDISKYAKTTQRKLVLDLCRRYTCILMTTDRKMVFENCHLLYKPFGVEQIIEVLRNHLKE